MSAAKRDEGAARGSPSFTPGPWEVVTKCPPTFSGLVAMVAEYPYLHIVLGEGHRLTRVPPPEWPANATLIAAAPDLCEALADAAKGLASIERNRAVLIALLSKAGLPTSWLDGIAPKLVRASAALAKAEGRSDPKGPPKAVPGDPE